MVRVTLWDTKFALVLLTCLSDLLTTNGQLRLRLFGRKRVCAPHIPLPVDNRHDLSHCKAEVAAAKLLKDPEADKRTPQVVLEHGYDLETYTVHSKDGYLLSLYRVPGGPRSPRGGWKPAVLLYHGLGSVSDSWFILPSDKNFVFKLVDAGYDVWIPNGRGSDFSQGHVSLDAEHDINYWDFSFHEMGVYDLPATVDLILAETGNEKIFYIGHSQGGALYLVGTSEIPELNDKIHASFLMAPAAYIGQAYIASFTALLPLLYTPIEDIVQKIFKGRWEMRAPRALLAYLGIDTVDVCSHPALQCNICDSAFFTFFDFNPHQINYTNTPNVVKMLNTASLKSQIHFGQNMISCQFRKYDYGLLGNLKRYGTKDPPSYHLENIRAPLHIFHGERDSIVSPPDIYRLAHDITPGVLRGIHRVEDLTFVHNDFAIARDADILVYSGIIDMMNGYVNNLHLRDFHFMHFR